MQNLPKSQSLPVITPGIYRLKYDLTLRCTPGLETLLAQGKYHHQSHLKAGETVKINKITNLSRSIWGQTESGWICLYMNHLWLVEAF